MTQEFKIRSKRLKLAALGPTRKNEERERRGNEMKKMIFLASLIVFLAATVFAQ